MGKKKNSKARRRQQKRRSEKARETESNRSVQRADSVEVSDAVEASDAVEVSEVEGRLSLCMIAKDEAHFLDRCLASVAGLVDEIVLVDTGSSDDTVEVARWYGARTLSYSWNNDFSAARNFGLAAATGEWILVLDCDEVLAGSDRDAIATLLQPRAPDAFRLTTRNYTNESNRAGWTACTGEYRQEEKEYTGWFPTTKIRLWRNRAAVRFEGVVHELVENSILAQGGVIGDCMVPVHHVGYAEKERADDLYVGAGEAKVRANPDDLQGHYELAIAYRNAGRLADALKSVQRAAGAGKEVSSGVYLDRELVLLVEADILDRLGRADEALSAYRSVIEEFPQSHQALNNLGSLLERHGSLDDAQKCYELALVQAPDNQTVADNLRRIAAKIERPNRLSVCIIARDEEKVLPRCLDSVAGIADEIVVVDTGSIDETVAIARRYNAVVGDFPWCDDFAAARNAALDMATGDWILCLDADEFLDSENGQKVARAKSLKPDRALSCILENVGAGVSSFRQLKMFPNDPAIRFERPIHETVLPSLRRLNVPTATTDVRVSHTGYDDPKVEAAKTDRYLTAMLDWHRGHPEDDDLAFRIGYTYFARGLNDQAQAYFQSVVDLGPERVQALSLYITAVAYLGRCLVNQGQSAEAVTVLERVLAARPDDALIHLVAAEANESLGNGAAAIRHAGKSIGARPDPSLPLDAEAIAPAARQLIERCRQQIGEAETAAEEVGGRLSLCMIVRDEESRLPACLESVGGLVDEIVVVDTGSTDDTVQVAKSFGARIGYFEWCDNFALARNASLELATGEWILWLDADDLLSSEDHVKIRRLLCEGRDKAYFFALDDHGYENVSCLQMRLFPNLPGVGFEMPIHEQITPSLIRLNVQLVTTDIRVVHTGYTTPEVVGQKKDRYLRIMEGWLEDHPEDYIVRSHVALTYHSTGRSEEAIEAYRAIVEDSDCLADRNFVVYTTSLLFMGRTLMREGRFEEALGWVQKALEMDPDYILTKLSLAEVYSRLEKFALALTYAGQVVEGDRQLTFFPIDYNEILYSARVIRAEAFFGLGNLNEAIFEYERAAETPTGRSTEALGGLSNLLKATGDTDRALAVLGDAIQRAPDNLQHRFNMGVLHLDRREFDEASTYFNQVLEQTPDYPPALLNLGYIAKSSGRLEEAESIYRRLAEADDAEIEARANLAHLLLDQDRFDEASTVFAAVLEKQSALLDINLGYLVTLAQMGGWQGFSDAWALVLSQLKEVPRHPDDLESPTAAGSTLAGLGAWLLERNQEKCAELAFAAAVHLDGKNQQARRCLGETLIREGQFWKAIDQFETILLSSPNDAAAFQRLGDCYHQLGVEEAAQLAYSKATEASGS